MLNPEDVNISLSAAEIQHLRKKLADYEYDILTKMDKTIMAIRSDRAIPDLMEDIEKVYLQIDEKDAEDATDVCLIGNEEVIPIKPDILKALMHKRKEDDNFLITELRGKLNREYGTLTFKDDRDPYGTIRFAIRAPMDYVSSEPGLLNTIFSKAGGTGDSDIFYIIGDANFVRLPKRSAIAYTGGRQGPEGPVKLELEAEMSELPPPLPPPLQEPAFTQAPDPFRDPEPLQVADEMISRVPEPDFQPVTPKPIQEIAERFVDAPSSSGSSYESRRSEDKYDLQDELAAFVEDRNRHRGGDILTPGYGKKKSFEAPPEPSFTDAPPIKEVEDISFSTPEPDKLEVERITSEPDMGFPVPEPVRDEPAFKFDDEVGKEEEPEDAKEEPVLTPPSVERSPEPEEILPDSIDDPTIRAIENLESKLGELSKDLAESLKPELSEEPPSESEPELELEPEPEPEPEPVPEFKTEPEPEPEPESEFKTESEPEPESVPEFKTEPEPESDISFETEPEETSMGDDDIEELLDKQSSQGSLDLFEGKKEWEPQKSTFDVHQLPVREEPEEEEEPEEDEKPDEDEEPELPVRMPPPQPEIKLATRMPVKKVFVRPPVSTSELEPSDEEEEEPDTPLPETPTFSTPTPPSTAFDDEDEEEEEDEEESEELETGKPEISEQDLKTMLPEPEKELDNEPAYEPSTEGPILPPPHMRTEEPPMEIIARILLDSNFELELDVSIDGIDVMARSDQGKYKRIFVVYAEECTLDTVNDVEKLLQLNPADAGIIVARMVPELITAFTLPDKIKIYTLESFISHGESNTLLTE